MAKKNTRSENSATHQPAPERRRTVRATTRTATSPDAIIAEPDDSPAVGFDTANDLQRHGDAHINHWPTHEEIAEAAYQRYLERGGGDGQDFDDWLIAERSLRERA